MSARTTRRRLVVVLTWITLPVDILSACEHWIIVIVPFRGLLVDYLFLFYRRVLDISLVTLTRVNIYVG